MGFTLSSQEFWRMKSCSLKMVSLLVLLAIAVNGSYVTHDTPRCRTEYDTETSYEQQCTTTYEQECNTVHEECCSSYERECATNQERQCSTRTEQQCSTSYEQE